MRYKDMKVADLKAACDEQGIEYTSSDRKADLVQLLEKYGEEQPEIIENGDIVPVFNIDMTVVQDDIAELTGAIDTALVAFEEYQAEPEAIENMAAGDLAICEDGLTAVLKEADEARLQLGRDYRKPLDMANARYKELTEPVYALRDLYAEKRQELRRSGLEATYIEFCDANGMSSFPSAVPFQRLLDKHPQWMRRDANAGKAAQKVEEVARKLFDDWGVLSSQRNSMQFFDEAEAEFFRTLDLSEALRLSERRTHEQQAIEAARAERQEVESFRTSTLEWHEVEPEKPIGRKLYRFTVMFTDSELASLREWKNATGCGVEWKFREVNDGLHV